ncbi:MAG: phytanoyl-CoA dioxygenase [Gammaproteobacteria bacterium]|nr:phytanoyl-CoA dioxygenase [Gammaproteobacteria bacterium]
MNILSHKQIEQYHQQGYCAPVDIMPESDAQALRDELERCERDYPEHIHGKKRNNTHHFLKFMDNIVFHPRVVGAVQDILGPDLLLYGSVLFIKEPESAGYVSWHQDGIYMGLQPLNFITPWIALTHSNPTNGCMSVIPGSHKDAIRQHHDSFGEDNILTRGQKVENVNENDAVDLILKPGQMSLHHPQLIHGSKPNLSQDRRIGIALQAYITPDVKQTVGKGYALHISGEDKFNHFQMATRPKADANPNDIKWRNSVEKDWSEILYNGAKVTREY